MADIIIYNTNDGKAAIKLYADNGTVWLTQAQIAELFNKERSGISKHIKNIFNEGELEEKSNVNFLHIANSDKPVAFYSLTSFLLSVFVSVHRAAHNSVTGPTIHLASTQQIT